MFPKAVISRRKFFRTRHTIILVALIIFLCSLLQLVHLQGGSFLLLFTQKDDVTFDKRTFIHPLNVERPFWAYEENFQVTSKQCQMWMKHINTGPIKTETDWARHSEPILGIKDLYKEDGCYTYHDRFDRYTDRSLNIKYNLDPRDFRYPEVQHDGLGTIQRPQGLKDHEWIFYLKNLTLTVNKATANNKDMISWRQLTSSCKGVTPKRNGKKTAILLRFYEGYVMSHDEVLNTRALIVEMSLGSRQHYDVRILVEVKRSKAAFTSRFAKEEILLPMMPREFWGLVEFWSESLIELLLPGLETGASNAWRGAYKYSQDRACIIASQIFSLLHQEYDFVYNWESDIRFIGDFRIFFEAIESFSRSEPLSFGLAKYTYWLIRKSKQSFDQWHGDKDETVGRGKEADLIVFNPMFELSNSGWWYRDDLQNMDPSAPARASIVSSLRMSRSLIRGMNLAAAESRKSMHCEAWPVTAALHSHFPPSKGLMYEPNTSFVSGLGFPFKAVFVPHPVYFKEEYTHTQMERHLWVDNFMEFEHEDFLQDSTFYYTSHQAGQLYKDWSYGLNHQKCRKPVLLHPVKSHVLLGIT